MIETLPVEPGSYALWLALKSPARIHVGRLGVVDFPAGDYLYLGSAHGSGGLKSRLRHHLRTANSPHWHIDYLRRVAAVYGIFYAVSEAPLECVWSQALVQAMTALKPAPGFGASDCHNGCGTHLVYFPEGMMPDGVLSILEKVEEELLVVFKANSGKS